MGFYSEYTPPTNRFHLIEKNEIGFHGVLKLIHKTAEFVEWVNKFNVMIIITYFTGISNKKIMNSVGVVLMLGFVLHPRKIVFWKQQILGQKVIETWSMWTQTNL